MAQIKSATASFAGKNRNMNDNCFLCGGYVPDTFSIQIEGRKSVEYTWGATTTKHTACLAVFGGVNENSSSETAACMAAKSLKSEISRLVMLPLSYMDSLMQRFATRVNDDILQAARQDRTMAGTGTSFVCLCLRKDLAVAFRLGNCQAFLLHQGEIRQLAWKNNAGNARSDATAYILGQIEDGNPVVSETTGIFQLQDQDCLLLCTSSLTDTVGEPVLKTFLGKNISQQAVTDLLKYAFGQGCIENITATYACWSAEDQQTTRHYTASDTGHSPLLPREEPREKIQYPMPHVPEKPKVVPQKMTPIHLLEAFPIWIRIIGLVALTGLFALLVWLLSGR